MFKKIQTILISFAEDHRPALWVLLLLITAIILFFPVNVNGDYSPIESLFIFGHNLPLFSIMFYLWLFLLLLLNFSKVNGTKTDWEKLILVSIASLVFLAFWVIIIPYGRLDFISNSSIVKMIQEAGMIPAGKATYLDFPGSHLLVLSLSNATGLNILLTANLFMVFNAILFSSLLYLLFNKLLHNSNISVFSAILLMLGNQLLSRGYTFWPGIISLDLLLAFMLVLINDEGAFLGSARNYILAFIVLLAITIMYFQASILLPLILIGIYIVQKCAKQVSIPLSLIVLFIFIPIIWVIYRTIVIFPMLVTYGDSFIKDIANGNFLSWVPFLFKSNVGEAFPLWSNIIRLFWWILIFGAGTILALVKLLRLKHLTNSEKLVTGGLLGVIILTIGTTLATPGGERFIHYLQYAAFFTIPALVAFSVGVDQRPIGYGFRGLVIITVILALPTFLVFNNKIVSDAFHSYDYVPMQFLESTLGNSKDIAVFNPYEPVSYYIPDIQYAYEMHGLYSETQFWQALDEGVGIFLQKVGTATQKEEAVYIMHPQIKLMGRIELGINPNDPRWQQLEQELEDGHAQKIYDNDYVQLWKPPMLH
jgi:hypothetical protein